MDFLNFVFIIHLFIGLISSHVIIENLTTGLKNAEKFIFSYLIFWANILITSFILSAFEVLDSNIYYFGLSIFIQCVFLLALFWNQKRFIIPKINISFDFIKSEFHLFIQLFLFFILFLQLIICFYYIPQTPDTLSMKLVKIYSYLLNGQLVPNSNFDGNLLYISPMNSAVTWMFFIKYKISFKILHFFSLFNWILVGLCSFYLCKKFKMSSFSSLFATTLLLCTDSFVMNATGDNDDILGASSFSIAVLAFIYWYLDKKNIYLIFSSIALGIHLGVKPFAVLYLGLFITLFCIAVFRSGIRNSYLFFIRNIKLLITCILMIFIMLSGVLNENYVARNNPFKFSTIMNSLRNRPFDIRTAGVNLFTQNLELFASPFLIPTGIAQRDHLANRANGIAKNLVHLIFGIDQKEVLEKISAHFNYTSITDNLFYDHSVNFGFYPHLLLMSACLMIVFHTRLNWLVLCLGTSFIFADLGYCLANKYIATIMRYWMIIFSITAPLIAYAIDFFRPIRKYKLIYSFYLILLFYTIFTSVFSLFNNYYRSIGAILNKKVVRSYEESFEPRVYNTLNQLKKFNILYVHNYPNAILHYFAPNSEILSKYSIQMNLPNVILVQPTPLGRNTYSHLTRYIDLNIDEINNDYAITIGKGLDTIFYVFNLDKKLENEGDKRNIFFAMEQPTELQEEWKGTLNLLFDFREREFYENRIYTINSNNKETKLTDWSNFSSETIKFRKTDKFLKIVVRNKKTKKEYFRLVPI